MTTLSDELAEIEAKINATGDPVHRMALTSMLKLQTYRNVSLQLLSSIDLAHGRLDETAVKAITDLRKVVMKDLDNV